MKLIDIGPYAGAKASGNDASGRPIVMELVDNMRRKGQLEGVEIETDCGQTKPTKPGRDDEVLAQIQVGVLDKIREYSDLGKHDAIVCRGSLEPAFYAGRQISKLPIAFALHSAVHAASVIGDRFSILEVTDPMAYIARRNVEGYGLGKKLVSVRVLGVSSVDLGTIIYRVEKSKRAKDPDNSRLLDLAMAQCRVAIDRDGADTIIIGCTPLQYLEDDLRDRLDKAGYHEIPLICEFSAAVEMAKVMVNMKLKQAARVYPGDELACKPEAR